MMYIFILYESWKKKDVMKAVQKILLLFEKGEVIEQPNSPLRTLELSVSWGLSVSVTESTEPSPYS